MAGRRQIQDRQARLAKTQHQLAEWLRVLAAIVGAPVRQRVQHGRQHPAAFVLAARDDAGYPAHVTSPRPRRW